MAFLFSVAEVVVKVGLKRDSAPIQFRKLTLPASSSLRELVGLLQDRFEAALAGRLTYVDTDEDLLTISTDQELCELHCASVFVVLH